MIYKQPSIYKCGGSGNKITTPADYRKYVFDLEDISNLCTFSNKLSEYYFKITKDEKYIYVLGYGLSNSTINNNDNLILLPSNYKLKTSFCFNDYCPQQNRPINQGWLLDYANPAYLDINQTNRIFISAFSFNGSQQYGYGISVRSPFQFEYEII